MAGYPRIAGQHATYVANTLREYANGSRKSDTGVNQMMRNVSVLLRDEDIQAVASYVQGLR